MPIYDYVCSTCSTRTEFIHGIDAPAPRFCPSCGAEGTLRKVFVPPAVHFKGSGWAKKDRSSASSARTKAAAATDSGSGDGASGAGGGSSDGGSSDGGSSHGGSGNGGSGDGASSTSSDPAPKKKSGGSGASKRPSGGASSEA